MIDPRSRLPLILLGTMTGFTLLGPLAILLVLKGGDRPGFPPDRPVEWGVFVGVCAAVAALMLLCMAMGIVNGRATRSHRGNEEAKP